VIRAICPAPGTNGAARSVRRQNLLTQERDDPEKLFPERFICYERNTRREAFAADGRFEKFKNTMFYDGDAGRQQHGFLDAKTLPL
jgi:hypothetical protein